MLTQKVDDILRLGEVDESIANIALVREVDTKIAEVITTKASPINDLLQFGSSHFVRDIAKHDGCANVKAFNDLLCIHRVGIACATRVLWSRMFHS